MLQTLRHPLLLRCHCPCTMSGISGLSTHKVPQRGDRNKFPRKNYLLRQREKSWKNILRKFAASALLCLGGAVLVSGCMAGFGGVGVMAVDRSSRASSFFSAIFRHNPLEDLIVRNCGISKAFPNYRQPRGGSSSRATKNNDNKGGKTLSDRQSGEGFSRSGARRKMGAIHRDLLKHANVIRGRSALLGKDEGEEEDGATGTGRRFHDGNNSDLLSGPRIIQGDKSKKGAWPWQISIQLELGDVGSIGHWCGGVLIHPMWMLTAAHCVVNPVFDELGGASWKVILSSDFNSRHGDDDGEISLVVEDIIPHPDFEEYYNDIALLRLPRDMRLSRLSPACLPVTTDTAKESFLNVRCIATGWGHTSHDEAELQDDLHEVDLRVTTLEECNEVYTTAYNISLESHHLCASPEEDGKGTCVGDSGGPLHCNMGDGHWYLAGITSFGSGCAKPGFPDVFTRITSYTSWIRQAITKHATLFPIPKHKTWKNSSNSSLRYKRRKKKKKMRKKIINRGAKKIANKLLQLRRSQMWGR